MSTEYEKFLASAPEAQREYRTIEIYHSQLSQTFRLVKDYVNRTFMLESDAPRDPSTLQTFTAVSMELTEPSENLDAEQILTVNLGTVGSEIQEELNAINGDGLFEPIQIVYRKYYSGSLNEPVLILKLSISDVNFDSYTQVTLTCQDLDISNKSSGKLYTLEDFPGLAD